MIGYVVSFWLFSVKHCLFFQRRDQDTESTKQWCWEWRKNRRRKKPRGCWSAVKHCLENNKHSQLNTIWLSSRIVDQYPQKYSESNKDPTQVCLNLIRHQNTHWCNICAKCSLVCINEKEYRVSQKRVVNWILGPLIKTKIGCCAAKFCQEREFHSGVTERLV